MGHMMQSKVQRSRLVEVHSHDLAVPAQTKHPPRCHAGKYQLLMSVQAWLCRLTKGHHAAYVVGLQGSCVHQQQHLQQHVR
jgi:hypothetical protein